MILKTILDYYELIQELYPTVSKLDLSRILQYGWKHYYLHNSYGGDVLIKQLAFWLYSGELMNDSIKYFNYYVKKISTKLRILHKRKLIPWDEYYYFALTRKEYEEYLELKNKKGRPRKKFTFSKIYLYKIYDDCNILLHGRIAIFKIPLGADLGFKIYKNTITTDKAELVLVREPLKFKDILLSNYDYQFIGRSTKINIKNGDIKNE